MKTTTLKKDRAQYTATRNACKLCTPLGASLVFKGIENAVPLLHGSQGCATYIRRYFISHFKEPVDIASSNFSEHTAIFGGGANLKLALDNLGKQYSPSMIGIATTCLSETIGDDIPMILKSYRDEKKSTPIPAIVHVSTPSYRGTHMDGFHSAVLGVVKTLADGALSDESNDLKADESSKPVVNLFPGMVSPADLRHLKDIFEDFGCGCVMLPDYSERLDGALWSEYQPMQPGGTSTESIRRMGASQASVELGRILLAQKHTAASWLEETRQVPRHGLGLPIGVQETDEFFFALEKITQKSTPDRYKAQRGRLIDSYIDGHKYVSGARAVVYGEEDLVVGMAAFLREIGIVPVLCASGAKSSLFESAVRSVVPDFDDEIMAVRGGVDFMDIEEEAEALEPDIFIGSSKGYTLSRRLKKPLLRIGFPIHDRVGAGRLKHLCYQGTQELFDRIVNTLIRQKQDDSEVGYTYM